MTQPAKDCGLTEYETTAEVSTESKRTFEINGKSPKDDLFSKALPKSQDCVTVKLNQSGLGTGYESALRSRSEDGRAEFQIHHDHHLFFTP